MKTALYKLDLGASTVPVRFVRTPNARRYILRLLPENVARVTIPRGGSLEYAREFLRRNTAWLEKQLRHSAADWQHGTSILLHGTPHPLRILPDPERLFTPLTQAEFDAIAAMSVFRPEAKSSTVSFTADNPALFAMSKEQPCR